MLYMPHIWKVISTAYNHRARGMEGGAYTLISVHHKFAKGIIPSETPVVSGAGGVQSGLGLSLSEMDILRKS